MTKAPFPLKNTSLANSLNTHRLHRRSVSIFFLMHGLCFSAWASRIPTVQVALNIGVGELGMILFALPLGFFISLPFSGWMISRFGSKRATIVSAVLYSLSLISIAACSSVPQVMTCLFFFGFFANALNLSMNTQAVEVEKLYQRRLLSTFHGLWSLAGFAGAAIGAWCIGRSIPLYLHFSAIGAIFILAIFIFSPRLVKSIPAEKGKGPLFAFPEKALLLFGAIAFCSAIIEGAMFDWSGIYFKDVVKAGNEFTGIGYTCFMIAMATGRFCADSLTERFNVRRVLVASGVLVTTGLLIAVVYPALLPTAFAFTLIGIGVSSVVPLVYSTAGRSKSMDTGKALTAVSSLGFVGFLIGPPMIGFVASLVTLKDAFLGLMVMSVGVAILSLYIKKNQ